MEEKKMEDWTRVVLYGTFDGFTYSTDDLPKTVVILDGGERVEIPNGRVISADQIVKKDEIKLKDVIARIKGFDLGTQKVWLNEILNELGSDYGSAKYKDGYEQGKLEGEWVGQQLKDADKIRLELNKPVVPQFVADWYEDIVDEFYVVLERLVLNYKNNTDMPICKWFFETEDALTILINMHQFGYTVEKEKRYIVKMKGLSEYTSYLNYDSIDDKWYFADDENGPVVGTHHTREQLEKAGFGWVFDCPGVEVREVEE